jgi:hypothetical protein
MYLAGSEWDKISHIQYFWIKIFLFFVIGTIVGFMNRRRFDAIKKNKAKIGDDINWALVGLLTFVTIAALGVLIAESVA